MTTPTTPEKWCTVSGAGWGRATGADGAADFFFAGDVVGCCPAAGSAVTATASSATPTTTLLIARLIARLIAKLIERLIPGLVATLVAAPSAPQRPGPIDGARHDAAAARCLGSPCTPPPSPACDRITRTIS